MELHTGQLIDDGRYCLGELLGEGGQALVFSAEDTHLTTPELPCRRAIKFLKPEFLTKAGKANGPSTFVRRFTREHKITGSFRHEYIVPIYDVCEVEKDGVPPHYVMDIVQGPSLYEVIDRYAKQAGLPSPDVMNVSKRQIQASMVPMDIVYRLIDQFCTVAAYIHKQGMLHRDLKPGNVLLVFEHHLPNIRLIDFGIVKNINDTSPLTKAGGILGTPDYMAPEALLGSMVDNDGRKWEPAAYTDLYAIGVIAYEMVTGRIPYVDKDLGEHFRIFSDPDIQAPDPAQYVVKIGKYFRRVVKKALAPQPWNRFKDAEEMRNAFREAQNLDRALSMTRTIDSNPPKNGGLPYDISVSSEPPPYAPSPAALPDTLSPPPLRKPAKKSDRRSLFAFGAGIVVAVLLAVFLGTNAADAPSSEPAPAATVGSPAVPKPESPASTAQQNGKRIPGQLSMKAAELLKDGNMMANGPVKDCKNAIVLFRQAAELSPDVPEVYRAIAHCENHLGHPALARAATVTHNSFKGVAPLPIP
jgi:serine/threonine-protein kinase